MVAPGRLRLFALLALAGTVAVLALFDPAAVPFFPPCIFRAATGISCPGCGTLRALHRLLRGDVYEAFRVNPVTTLAVPLLGAFALARSRRLFRGA